MLESLPRASYFSHVRAELIPLIPSGVRRLLDVGCGAGHTGELARRELGIPEVCGIEFDREAASAAATRLDHVVQGDIESMELPWPAGYFDCMLCADVLEHTKDPWALLRKLRPYLTPQGVIVASIPNLQHLQPLSRIVLDRFEYEDEGILDRTHLRFFTLHTIRAMFEREHYAITFVGANQSSSWKFRLVKWLSFGALRKFCVFQYLIVARKTQPATANSAG